MSSFKANESDDEFESADEGESASPSITKPPTSPLPSPSIITDAKPVQSSLPPSPPRPVKPVSDGWGDWNLDDDDDDDDEGGDDDGENKVAEVINTNMISAQPLQQDSTSSRSSTPSKTSGSLSHIGSDEDELSESSDQQRLQRKKYRKKPLETNLHQEETPSPTTTATAATTTKHEPKDAHFLLDQLAAQAPKQTVNSISILKNHFILFFL